MDNDDGASRGTLLGLAKVAINVLHGGTYHISYFVIVALVHKFRPAVKKRREYSPTELPHGKSIRPLVGSIIRHHSGGLQILQWVLSPKLT